MNNIIKTITLSSEMVTNLSNDNVSLQTKIKSLKQEIESVKKEIISLEGDIKPNSKLLKTYPGLKIDTVKI